MYAAMGLAVLAKGPVGLVLPTAVIGLFLLIARLPGSGAVGSALRGVPSSTDFTPFRAMHLLAPLEPLHFLRTCWSMRPLTALFAAAAVALPWYWAVGLATGGEFLRGFFFEHNLARATGVMEGHSGNVLYYPAAILLGFFPWSIFALPLAIDTVLQLRKDRFHAGYLLAVCWIGVFVGLFSLARTKLPSYVTPCYPALAMLAGDYIDRWSRQAAAVAGGWLLAAFGCLALAGIGVLVEVPLAAQKHHLAGEEWLGLIGLVPLAGGVACLGLAAVRNLRAAAGVLGATAVTLAVLLFALAAQRIDRHQSCGQIAAAIRAAPPSGAIATYKILEPTWVFYGGRPITELKLAPHAGQHHSVTQFFETNPAGLLIARQSHYQEIAPHLPTGVVVTQTPQFLKDDSLLILRRETFPAEAQQPHLPSPIRLR
jgi:4-amino-4-deoxy-L-arabinose transferase-like glycosyltransferase